MYKDDNNAIRYLMKEMDPSEEMEFEKMMREDENLLIEVESLRATNRKLSGLPSKNPPKELIENISDDLKQLQATKKRSSQKLTSYVKRGVAAAILMSGLTGALYYYVSLPDTVEQTATESTTQVDPWVDRNEVLRFQDEAQTTQTGDLQPDLNRSFEKLQLVNDPGASNSASGILLTGSSN